MRVRTRLIVVLALVAALTVPAAAPAVGGASDGPGAVTAKKKKCKKKKKKCKKKKAPYAQGRWAGNWAEGPAELFFNVVGSRLYTGPFDSLYGLATCQNSSGVGSPTYTDTTFIKPVEARIAGGSFSGSGTYPTGSGRFIPWKISGRIQGKSITGGVFEIGPYPDFAGDPCAGTTHFSASWYGAYTR